MFLLKKFMYVWLGHPCYAGAFSSCGAQASHHSGFPCCRAQALEHVGSVAVAHSSRVCGLSSCGSQV